MLWMHKALSSHHSFCDLGIKNNYLIVLVVIRPKYGRCAANYMTWNIDKIIIPIFFPSKQYFKEKIFNKP